MFESFQLALFIASERELDANCAALSNKEADKEELRAGNRVLVRMIAKLKEEIAQAKKKLKEGEGKGGN